MCSDVHSVEKFGIKPYLIESIFNFVIFALYNIEVVAFGAYW